MRYFLMGLLASFAAAAQPTSFSDDDPAGPTVDGVVVDGEYAGFSSGLGTANTLLGTGSEVHLDATNGALHFGLTTGGGALNDEVVVFYLDTPLPGNNPTAPVGTVGGPTAAVGSPSLGITYAPGFSGEVAISVFLGEVSVWTISGLVATEVYTEPVTTGTSIEWEIPLSVLGLAPGDSFRWIGTVVDETPVDTRLSEYHGVAVPPPATTGSVVLAAGDFNEFRLPRAPIVVNTVDDELNSDGDCSLAEALEAAAGGDGDGCVFTGGAARIELGPATYSVTTTPDVVGADVEIVGQGTVLQSRPWTVDGSTSLALRSLTAVLPEGGFGPLGTLELNQVDATVDFSLGGDPLEGASFLADASTVQCTNSIICLSGSELTFTNSTVQGDGLLLLDCNLGGVTVTHSTLIAAVDLFACTDASYRSSVLAGTSCGAASPVSMGQNVLQQGLGCTTDVTDTETADPLLGPLADNGGPTRTRLPEAGSPVLDIANVCDVDVDQRGAARPGGLVCDAGAVEVQVPLDVAVSIGLDETTAVATAPVGVTVTATSNAPAAVVAFNVDIPEGLSVSGLPSECTASGDGSTVSCSLTDVLGASPVSFVLSGDVDSTGAFTVGVTRTGDADTNPANDSASEVLTVVPVLRAALTALQSTVEPGEPAVYTLSMTGTCGNSVDAQVTFDSAVTFDLIPAQCTAASTTELSCTGLGLNNTDIIRATPAGGNGTVVTATVAPDCAGDSQSPPPETENITVQTDPCTSNFTFTVGAQGFSSPGGLFEYVLVDGDGVFKTGGAGAVPPGAQFDTLTRAVDVPTVADGGPRPELEVVFRLTGDPNPNFDRFTVCINDTGCAAQSANQVYGTGRNTVNGQSPTDSISDSDFNDGVYDHVFVDMSAYVGQTVTVTLAYNSVVASAAAVDGVRVSQVRLGSDVDGDGAYEGSDALCDPCWDGDLDGYVHPDSPGLATTCPNAGTADCDDTTSEISPAALEQCGVPGDEDCDLLADGADPDCGDEDCADGLDNNGDGATDCDDAACVGDGFCDVCSTSFTFDTGDGGWLASDNDPDLDPATQLFEVGTDGSGTAVYATVLGGTVGSANTAPLARVQAWLTRNVDVPAGVPAAAVVVEYELDGDSDPARDVFGVCFAATPAQCDAEAPPGLVQFSTTTSTTGPAVASIPVPDDLVGTTFSVVIFYDTVDDQQNDNGGLTIRDIHVRSDADEDGLYEAPELTCDRCVDGDNDGYGAEAVSAEYVLTCTQAERDCDDDASDVNPGAAEQCGVAGDQNCNGLDDVDEASCSVCGDGTVTEGEDCDDGGLVPGDGCSATCELEAGALVVSEIHLTSLVPGADGEQWIEIRNATVGARVDLARAELFLRRKTGATVSLDQCDAALGFGMNPGDYFVVSLGSEASADGTPADAFCDTGFQLSASGDSVGLVDGSSQLVVDLADFDDFECELAQADAAGFARSLELIDPNAGAAGNDTAGAWCLSQAFGSYANSGNHFGSPGAPGGCAELACNNIDDDCDGSTDEDLPDTDVDGVCDDVDCDPNVFTCNTDCATDDDFDAVPDCRDGCIDADFDGWGVPGGAETSTCKTVFGVATPDCNDQLSFVSPEGAENPSAGSCTNGVDDDCDGLPDCADPACGGSGSCEGEACAGALPIACGESVTLEPTTDTFTCGEGADGVLVFNAPSDQMVTIQVENTGKAQFLGSVFEGACTDLSCDAPFGTVTTTCQADGSEPVSVTSGTDYFIVVDTVSECTGVGTNEVTVKVLCGEVCSSGDDEDGDGLVGCLDPDCASVPLCGAVDTDGDGVDNASELVCSTDPADELDTPSADDVADPDDDDLINCVDPNDDNDPALDSAEAACASGAKNDATIYPGAPKQCQAQDVDADCNGLLDIDEDACGAAEQQCGDEEDNDNDGLFDCLDPDCVPNALCAAEDFDSDGVANAIEIACLTKPLDPNSEPTPAEASDLDGDDLPNCADLDDDGDGFEDVQEILCASDPTSAASTPIDTDGDTQCDASDPDDDGDGFGDELELDCGSSPLLVNETPVSPGFDLDGDGVCDAKDLDIDGDGWSNGIEESCGTNLQDASLNPTTQGLDGDGDNLCDAVDPDDDNDGWSDELEGLCLTQKNNDQSVPADADGDGICDLLDEDTDDDGWPDELEIQCETDPLLPESNPTAAGADQDNDLLCDALDSDDDGDGWLDVTEQQCGGDKDDPAVTPPDLDADLVCDDEDDDIDGDGWDNGAEELCGTSPADGTDAPADTDGDGVCDSVDPDADPDGDGWSTFDELSCGTDPKVDTSVPTDTDTDGTCDQNDSDDDGDDWSDEDEVVCGTDPLLAGDVPADTDGDSICNTVDTDDDADGVPDADEVLCGTDPLSDTEHPTENDLLDFDDDGDVGCVDTDDDNDGLPDVQELALGTKPNDADTDDDGLLDGQEDANQNGVLDPTETDATRKDTDSDGLEDGEELASCYEDDEGACVGTDPLVADTDDDGLLDGQEDADADGIVDIGETNPLNPNSDDDTDFSGEPALDGDEVECASDPLDPDSVPVDLDGNGICDGSETDSDADGVPDGVENLCGTNPLSNASTPSLSELGDTDDDGAIDCVDPDDDDDGVDDEPEIECGSNPLDGGQTPTAAETADTDGDGLLDCSDPDDDDDGLSDMAEAANNTDPLDADSDDDGVLDGLEVTVFDTDPNDTDTDGDGILDGTELGIAADAVTSDTDLTVFVPDDDPSTVTNAKNADSDDDGVPDGEEDVNKNGRVDDGEGDPLSNKDGLRDTDGDGLIDRRELELGTDINNPDTDGDDLNDKLEVDVYGSDPLRADSDGGGVTDGIEVENGTDPTVAGDDFAQADVTGDDVFGCSSSAGSSQPLGGGWILLALVFLGLAVRRRRSAVLGALLAIVVLMPGRADAQARAVGNANIENFFPSGGRYRVFSVEQSRVGPQWQPYAHVLFHGQRESLKVQNGPHREVLVESHNFADINIGVGLFDVLQLDISLPVALEMSSADDVQAIEPVSGAGLGDLVFRVRATAIDNRRGGFGLGFTAGLTLPTGDGEKFRGDEGVGVLASVIPDFNSRWVTVGVNLGVRIRTETVEFLGHEFGHELTFGLGTDVHAWPDVIDIGLELFGRTPLLDPFADRDTTALEFLGGPKWWIIPGLSLQAAAGAGLVQGIGTPDFRFMVGLTWSPRPEDSDGDGIDDRYDECPMAAEDMDGYADRDGCPEADNDNDGIADADDRCPVRPEDMNGVEDDDGCPEGDADKDGVADADDQCPDQQEDRDAFQDADGCPEEDNDKDGILDAQDKCPNLAENKDGFMDEDGCPDEKPVAGATGQKTVVVKKVVSGDACRVPVETVVTFRSGGYALSGDGKASVATAAKAIQARLKKQDAEPVVEVSVNGYAQSGAAVESLTLSARRARVVLKALAAAGVPRRLLHARGYGDAPGVKSGDRVDFTLKLGGSECAKRNASRTLERGPTRTAGGAGR